MTSYFEDFKKSMKKRFIIIVSLDVKLYDDVFLLVDVDYTFFQVEIPRVRWMRPLGYEINANDVSTTITILLVVDVDKNPKEFEKYEIDKSKITMELKTASIKKKNKKKKKNNNNNLLKEWMKIIQRR